MSTENARIKAKKGRPVVDSEAVAVRLVRGQLTALDNWRRLQPDMPTRPEAVRRLIELGLAADKAPKP